MNFHFLDGCLMRYLFGPFQCSQLFLGLACLALTTEAIESRTVFGDQLDVWFGTTTPRNGLSRGIYHASFNTKTGKLSAAELAAEANGCGFLAMHPDGQTLYATGSPAGDAGNSSKSGTVSAYRVSGRAGKQSLIYLNSVPTGDGGAAHLSTDHGGRVLLSAQYGGGSTSLYELDDDGSIARRVQTIKHESLAEPAGSGVVPRRQDAPHAHWTGTSPDDRWAFVPDLGMDKVVIYSLDPETPSIDPHGFGVTIPGGGPRHMAFDVAGNRVFLLNELSLSISVFDFDAQAGSLTRGQTVATLPDEVKAAEIFNSASEIRVHPSGQFVYSANRGHDTITAFSIADDGNLAVIEVEPIRGGWPRNFNLTPDGRWLIAAGRDSNTATVFEINAETGALTFMRETQFVPTPICVLFSRFEQAKLLPSGS
ncbi:MAG: lactonase family protein [Planctomycetota bacterium]